MTHYTDNSDEEVQFPDILTDCRLFSLVLVMQSLEFTIVNSQLDTSEMSESGVVIIVDTKRKRSHYSKQDPITLQILRIDWNFSNYFPDL